jgi:hypothetical protein
MHFEHEGRSLWYGTPDALAPEESVQAGTEIAITIGVSPVDASNYVELLYRVNHGPTEVVAARWLQNDPSGKAQYFRARLPAFRAGDTVEYIPICRCAGRQVPSPDQARQFASSIRVTDAQAKSLQGLRLRASDSGDEVARLHERLELHPALSVAATPRPAMESPTLPLSSGRRKSMKPTAVVAQMVKSGETPLAAPAVVREQVRDAAIDITDIIRYLTPKVHITAPAENAKLGSTSFTITGTASCKAFEDLPVGPPREFDATDSITAVDVRLGNTNPFQSATPTGSGTRPWATWFFTASTPVRGPLTLTAQVRAERTGFGSGSATSVRQVIIDLAPPTLTVNPPADVTTATPPYTATITGTAADDAGVAAVEWRLGSSGTFQAATGTTAWSASVALPGLGAYTVTLRARDGVGNVSPTQNVTVNVIDATPPALSIITPLEGEMFTLAASSVTVEVRGTASDTQTGVALVEWALDGQTQFTRATPKSGTQTGDPVELALHGQTQFATAAAEPPPDPEEPPPEPPEDWSTWSALIPITVAGNHTITIRARDKATPTGNLTGPEQRGVVVVQPFQPKDPEAVFSAAAYLDDLLDFATRRAKTAGGVLISRQLLVDTFLQPFTDLVTRNNRLVANQPVHQVRLCIEVLRRYLAKHGRSTSASAETTYRQAAYVALLRHLGTSHEEIRLARVADDATRAALASRLGIDLTRLDQLLLQPAQVTEAALKNLFGLEETTLKPLADSVLPEPHLLIWQKEHLRAVWQQQDEAARSVVDTPVPVIDPDLMGEGDLRTPAPGNAAYDLWQARQQHVANQLVAIKATREAQPTQLAGFDRIVTDILGPIAALLALADEYQRGNPIEAQLRAQQLTLQPFFHLMRVHQLAVAGTVLDAEWDDVYAILVQVQKFRLYATWRGEERQKNLTLGPNYFTLPESTTSQPPVVLPPWRASPQARRAWRSTLEARMQQEQALTQALQSVVDATEEATLPMLRDACIAAIAPNQEAAGIANRLTQELALDCKSSGRQKTTRVHQALETLQDVLFSLRTGRFKTMSPVLGTTNPAVNWVLALDEADFDEEWRWMGAYATWHAAIRVFAYPESYLLPELRPPSGQTEAYQTLMQELRNQPRLTPAQARTLAATTYHQAVTSQLGPTLPESLRHGSLVITEQLSDTQLGARRSFIQDFFSSKGITNPHPAPNYLKEICYFVPMALALQLQKSGQYLAALDWIETVYTDHLALNERKIYHGLALEETIPTQFQRNPDNWLRGEEGLNPHEIVTVRASAYTRFTLMALVRCYLDFADAEFTRDSSESIPRARALYSTALELLALPELQPPSGGNPPNPFPPNPVPQAFRLHAELNLFKLRSGRNIAGIERQSAPESPQPVTLGSLPVASDGGRLLRPTPYRYGVLVERAKNLVSIAQQVEGAFLAALEKRDAEAYNLLKAGHDLQLAEATVDLQALRVTEAEGGEGLAELQQARAMTQRDTYRGWIQAGLNQWERYMLKNYEEARDARNFSANLDAAVTTAQAVNAAASGGLFGTGLGGGLPIAGLIGVLSLARADAVIAANNAESAAQVNAARASYERRQQEWELQRQLADHDVNIGIKQFELAQAHTDIVRQEQSIAQTQHDQAQATVEFLANKFTNAELYEWMSGILGGAYSYFLQQATAMAQLAQYQLAFERQETPPAFIQADYWEAPGDTATPGGGQGTEPDRRGLTGSVRLLQDITRLDQFAFETNKRKLQLAQIFSLAQILPAEFQRFRETGSLPFATPMVLFDQGFPGHYLRLIKRVRVSVIALIPPTRGIRATLIASGLSRVVSGGDVFQTIVVRRDPEVIAFTSPSNATGLLELEPEGELLLPFESLGVDTSWELQMPKAANPFDYRTIADVLFTVEYTALQSFTYRQQVIQELDGTVSAERAFSVRDQFADQWYALHNPKQATTPMAIRFTMTGRDFPPHLDDVRIQHVLLAVVRAQGRTFEISNTQLLLTAQGETAAVGGAAGSSIEGLISTRRGNASAWTALIDKLPIGAWELALPNTEEMKNRFKNEEIDDILLVLTYAGRTPAWPA